MELSKEQQTQCDGVLDYMKNVGPITTLDAIRCFGCTRLSGIIYHLERNRNIPIIHERVPGKRITKYSVLNCDKNGQMKLF